MKYRLWLKKCKEYARGVQYNCLVLGLPADGFGYLCRAVDWGGKTRHRRRDLRSARRGKRKISKLRQIKDPPFDRGNSKQGRKYERRLKRYLKEE